MDKKKERGGRKMWRKEAEQVDEEESWINGKEKNGRPKDEGIRGKRKEVERKKYI